MMISMATFSLYGVTCQRPRVCQSVQQGHSHFCGRSALALCERGKMARTPWRVFSTDPVGEFSPQSLFPLRNQALEGEGILRDTS